MSFTTQNLVGNRVVVKGTDINGAVGEQVVDSTEWTLIHANTELDIAKQAFDEAVEEFFAPITEAAEKLGKTLEMPEDAINYLVLDEGVEGTESVSRNVVHLSQDSVILRLIEAGDDDRLVWVNERLEVLAEAPAKKAARKRA
jgi:hypothetical protein